MVWIARARPVTQRHGRGYTRFAGIDDPPVFRCEPTEIQQVDFESFRSGDDSFSDFGETKGFRHFSGTGLVAAGGAVDEQNA
jgi:hypothetical protein